MEIKSCSTKIVKPKVATQHTTLKLSNLDHIVPAYHTPFLFLYPNNGSPDFMPTNTLQASLEQALVEFYPLAGRLKVQDNGRTCVECSDQGVEFIEAFASGKLADLGTFQPCQAMRLLNPLISMKMEIGSPIALVQVTRFECSGVALVAAFSHRVVDGYSASLFLHKWSSLARNGQGTYPQPCFFTHPELEPSLPPLDHYGHALPVLDKKTMEAKQVTANLFMFDASTLKMLQDKLGGTKFEVLASHMWCCVTKAKSLNSSSAVLNFLVNGRNRFSPPLPKGMFGNIVFNTTARTSVQELNQSTGAKLIHDAIVEVDKTYMKLYIDRIQTGVLRAVHEVEDNAVLVNDWRSFQFYSIDFGFGNPVFVGLCTSNKFEPAVPMILLLPHAKPGTVAVGVWGLTEEQMTRLEALIYLI